MPRRGGERCSLLNDQEGGESALLAQVTAEEEGLELMEEDWVEEEEGVEDEGVEVGGGGGVTW